ncbi:MAG: hypothetical protein JRG67_13530, partial [Deltaproteobacteria bacterium]|nr:hypothetical protein [Deltaproteobacteria bacterium]
MTSSSDRIVGQCVDDDEGTGFAILLVIVDVERAVAAEAHLGDVVELDPLARLLFEGVHVDLEVDLVDLSAHRLGGVLDQVGLFGVERLLVHPDDVGIEAPRDSREVAGLDDHVAAADVDLVFESNRHRLACEGLFELTIVGVDRCDFGFLA